MTKKFVALLGCLCLSVLALSAPAMAGKEFKLQCVYPPTALAGKSTQFFADEVKRLTNGEVTVKVFWPGQAVGTKEAFDALRQGMIDAYSGSLLYFAGLVPEANVQWLPFNWSSPEEAQDILFNKGFTAVLKEALAKHGVTYLAPMSVATMGLLTKFPVKTMDDIKGKKIRAVGMEAHIVKALGASAVAIAGAEQYMALQRGVVDGTDYPWYTLEKYKLAEVLQFISSPAFHTPGIIEIIFNTKAFNALNPDQQKAMQEAAMNASKRSFTEAVQWDQDAVKFSEKTGIKIVELSADELAKFRKALAPLWEAEAKRSPLSAKLVQILKDNLKAKGVNF